MFNRAYTVVDDNSITWRFRLFRLEEVDYVQKKLSELAVVDWEAIRLNCYNQDVIPP